MLPLYRVKWEEGLIIHRLTLTWSSLFQKASRKEPPIRVIFLSEISTSGWYTSNFQTLAKDTSRIRTDSFPPPYVNSNLWSFLCLFHNVHFNTWLLLMTNCSRGLTSFQDHMTSEVTSSLFKHKGKISFQQFRIRYSSSLDSHVNLKLMNVSPLSRTMINRFYMDLISSN